MANLLANQHTSSTAEMKPAREVPGYDVEDQMTQGMPVYQGSAMVKAGFIRKVYGILSIQLLFTACSSAFFMFHEPTRMVVLANPRRRSPERWSKSNAKSKSKP